MTTVSMYGIMMICSLMTNSCLLVDQDTQKTVHSFKMEINQPPITQTPFEWLFGLTPDPCSYSCYRPRQRLEYCLGYAYNNCSLSECISC